VRSVAAREFHNLSNFTLLPQTNTHKLLLGFPGVLASRTECFPKCPTVRWSLCPSVTLSVCPFVRMSVCPSVRPSDHSVHFCCFCCWPSLLVSSLLSVSSPLDTFVLRDWLQCVRGKGEKLWLRAWDSSGPTRKTTYTICWSEIDLA